MAFLWSLRLVFFLLIATILGSASAMTKPFPANETYTANSSHALYSQTSAYVNPWASGPCYASGTDASTFCSCSKLYDSLAQLQTVTTTGTPPEGGLVWTDTITMSTITEKSYEPPRACCSKTCEIYASSVQIIYWHVDLNTVNASITTAPASSPYSTIAGNITFVSPSVYVAYHGLNAYYDCGYFSSFTTGAVYDTTIAYPPNALSTYVGPLWMKAQTGPEAASLFQAINYTEFQEYEANTANAGYSKNLKIPSDLAGIDPVWSTCTPGMYGSWDPPRVLTAAPNMVAPTPAQPDNDPSATAAPAAGIAPTNVPAAPTPPPTHSATGLGSPATSLDPGSKSKDTQPSGSNDPAWSVGRADSVSKGGNTGENPTPPSKQGQGSDPANQGHSQNNMPNHSSSGAPNSNPAAGSSGIDGNGNGAGALTTLNVDPQDSQNSLNGSPGSTVSPVLFNPVVVASPSPLIVGDSTIEKASNGGAVIGKSTYTAGYEGQISNMPISVGVDKIIIGTTTHALPTSAPVLIAGESMVKAANGGVIIGTSTYTPGSQAQISGKAFSVGIDSVVIGDSSYAIPTPGTADAAFIDSQSISRAPNGGAILGDSATIGLGSQGNVNGHAISVGASTIVFDGVSYALPSSAGAILQAPSPQPNAPVTLTNRVVLTPGGNAATVSGTTYAIASGESGLIINGQIVSSAMETKVQSVFTVAGQIFTAAPSGFTIGDQSVALDGNAATLDGTVISLGSSGLQVGSATIPLTSAQTTEGALGGLIMSGFRGDGDPGTTVGAGNGSSVVAFTGKSSRAGRRIGIASLGAVVTVMAVIALLM